MTKRKHPARVYFNKFVNSMEYTSKAEMIGQICFEWFLVPSVYFDEHKCLLHAAGFVTDQGEGILVGGTGGVGKTTIELALCFNGSYQFLCDDIGVVGKDGQVYPNLAFPKIYGYNMENNPVLKAHVFKDRSLLDRGSWAYRYFAKGPKKVRRKISPKKIFKGYASDPVPFAKYAILLRENRDDIQVADIDKETAIDMSIDVMLTEYSHFHNHIQWHEYNHRVMDTPPILRLDETIARWKACMRTAFEDVRICTVRIPTAISHEKFMTEIPDIINERI
jgi:hypothetical protein